MTVCCVDGIPFNRPVKVLFFPQTMLATPFGLFLFTAFPDKFAVE
jgi:hypothetical protein